MVISTQRLRSSAATIGAARTVTILTVLFILDELKLLMDPALITIATVSSESTYAGPSSDISGVGCPVLTFCRCSKRVGAHGRMNCALELKDTGPFYWETLQEPTFVRHRIRHRSLFSSLTGVTSRYSSSMADRVNDQ